MNIEKAVIENLRLLPMAIQQDVLVFIHSLRPFDPQAEIKAAILKQVMPPLQNIQNFHDGLPSAVYSSRLLRSIQALAREFPDSACGQVLQKLDQSLSPDQQWGCYTVEYYQAVTQLLFELVSRPCITTTDLQLTICTIEQISQTMTQPGIVMDQELEDYVEA